MDNTNKNEAPVASSDQKENGKKPVVVGIISCPGFTGVRLRKNPDLSAETLTILPEGTGVKMVKQHDAVWSEVEFNHKIGYVQSRFIMMEHTKNT